MLGMIKSEILKTKRTALRWLVVLAPVIVVSHTFLGSSYYITNAYNWWYIFIFPGFISLFATLVNQLENKKLKYRAVFSLPLSLERIWKAKIISTTYFVFISVILHFIFIIAAKFFVLPSEELEYTIINMLAASILIFVYSLWQIPLCLYISKKIGLALTLIFNLVANVFFSITLSYSNCWIFSPYSWSSRVMIKVLNIMPNGLKLEEKFDYLKVSNIEITLSVIAALVLFALLSYISSIFFSKEEVE